MRYHVVMRPLGSPAELERRRWRAIHLLKSGLSISGVARRLGCSHSSVILWRDAVRRKGESALKAKPVPGRPAKLSRAQLKKLPALLLRGALAWGYGTELWTTERVAKVIEREFGVHFHRAHVGRLLADLGWTCQKPERRALERDDEAIERWKRHRWIAVKKKSGD
jgi:transposase